MLPRGLGIQSCCAKWLIVACTVEKIQLFYVVFLSLFEKRRGIEIAFVFVHEALCTGILRISNGRVEKICQ